MSDPQLSGAAKSAGYFLADYHRNVTGLAYPSCKTLARRIGVSVRAAQEAVRVLRTRGWIKLVESHRGPGQSNLYALNWGNTIEPSQIRQHKKKGADKENTNSSAGHANDPSAPNTNESSDNSSYSFLLENPLKKEALSETDPVYDSHEITDPKSAGICKPAKASKTIGLQSGTEKVDVNEVGNSLDLPQQSQRQRPQEALEKLKQWELDQAESRRYGVDNSEYRRFKEAHDNATQMVTPKTLIKICDTARHEYVSSADQVRYMTKRYEAILRTPSSKNDQNESKDETIQGAGKKHSKPTLTGGSKD